MQPVNSTTGLKQAIANLQQQKTENEKAVRVQLSQTYESIKPVNLIKNTFADVTQSPEVKDGIMHSAAGLVAGYLFKKVYEDEHDGPAKQLVGAAIAMGITNAVANNPQVIKMATRGAFSVLKLALLKMQSRKP